MPLILIFLQSKMLNKMLLLLLLLCLDINTIYLKAGKQLEEWHTQNHDKDYEKTHVHVYFSNICIFLLRLVGRHAFRPGQWEVCVCAHTFTQHFYAQVFKVGDACLRLWELCVISTFEIVRVINNPSWKYTLHQQQQQQ